MKPDRVVVVDDPHIDWEEAGMQFRLTYDGPLLAETADRKRIPLRADGKQEIRKRFHRQLKRAWEVMPQLNGGVSKPGIITWVGDGHRKRDAATLASENKRGNYAYVPLISRDLVILCSLQILFLRPENPGGVILSGDMDNRLKTLVDALTMPRDEAQLGKYLMPSDDETPFFCLLQDDSLISHLSLETDTMLEPVGDDYSPNDARVVITANMVPSGFDTSDRYGSS